MCFLNEKTFLNKSGQRKIIIGVKIFPKRDKVKKVVMSLANF